SLTRPRLGEQQNCLVRSMPLPYAARTAIYTLFPDGNCHLEASARGQRSPIWAGGFSDWSDAVHPFSGSHLKAGKASKAASCYAGANRCKLPSQPCTTYFSL